MSAIDELAGVLRAIYAEIGNLSIASDGEVRRRIAAAVVDGRGLLAKIKAGQEHRQGSGCDAEETRTNPYS